MTIRHGSDITEPVWVSQNWSINVKAGLLYMWYYKPIGNHGGLRRFFDPFLFLFHSHFEKNRKRVEQRGISISCSIRGLFVVLWCRPGIKHNSTKAVIILAVRKHPLSSGHDEHGEAIKKTNPKSLQMTLHYSVSVDLVNLRTMSLTRLKVWWNNWTSKYSMVSFKCFQS